MKSYEKKGDEFQITAGSAIASGDLVKSGVVTGVALNDYANGEEAIVYIEGVYEVAKKAGVAFGVGDVAYEESLEASNVDTGDKMGIVVEAALAGDATVKVKLER